MLTAILGDSSDPTLWMPQQASTYAAASDNVFYGVYYLSVFFFVLIVAPAGRVHHQVPAPQKRVVHESSAGAQHGAGTDVDDHPDDPGAGDFLLRVPRIHEHGGRAAERVSGRGHGKTWNWTFIYDRNCYSDRRQAPHPGQHAGRIHPYHPMT